MAVNRSKPKKIPRLSEAKIYGAIQEAKKTVRQSRERIDESKIVCEIARDLVEESRRKRGA